MRRAWHWSRAVAVLVSCLVACAGEAAPWSTQLQGIWRARVAAIDAMPDGGVVVAGTVDAKICLSRLDGSGALVWQVLLEDAAPPSGLSFVADVVALPDGSATVLLGGSRGSSGTSEGACSTLVHVDGAGSVAWSASWFVGQDGPRDLLLLTDGTYVVAITDHETRRTVLARRDASGAAVWTRALVPSVADQAPRLAAAADGGFAVALDLYSSLWLGRCDAAGTLTWQRRITRENPADGYVGMDVQGVMQAPDGGWTITGDCYLPGHQLWQARTDDSGTLAWSHALVVDRGRAGRTFVSQAIAATPDGGAVLLGRESSTVPVLVRLDQFGAITWLRKLTGSDLAPAVDVAIGPVGEIVLAGTGISGNPFVVLADASGNADGCLASDSFATGMIDLPLAFEPAIASLVDISGTDTPAPAVVVTAVGGAIACAPACTPDSREPDDGSGAAASIGAAPLALAGNFCDDAEDWMRVDACIGSMVTFETSGLAGSTDTALDLFAADRVTLLGSDDDGGANRGSRLTWTAARSGPFYLRVRQVDGSIGPDHGYRLTIDVAEPMRDTFVRRVGPYGLARTSSASASLSGAVFAGAHDDGTVWAVATDAQGAIEWTSSWDTQLGSGYPFTIPLGDGGAILALKRTMTSDLATFADIGRLAPGGSLTWARGYQPPVSWRVGVNDGALLADGGIVLVGVAEDTLTYTDSAWIMAMDATGGMRWDRRLALEPRQEALAVAPTPDGGILIGGYCRAPSLARGFLTKVDAAGNLSWHRSLDQPVFVVAPTSDGGGFAVSGGVIRLDGSGRVMWQRAWQGSRGYLRARAASPTSNDGLLLASDVVEGAGEAVVLRADPSGRLEWARRVHAESALLAASHVQELPTGHVLLAASDWTTGSNPPGRLIRLSASGNLDTPCSLVDAYPLVERGSNVVVTDAAPAFEPLGGALVVQNWNARSILAGVNDACDCACGTQAAPLEVARASTWEPLILHPLGRMTWEPASVSGACWFNVYRGVLSRLRSGDHGQCVAADLPFGEATDPSPPPAGDGWFYLVTGESDSGEGPLGPDSLGTPRGLTSPCP